ncbi:hypothetical protein F5144DRAFT_556663 [Chaetomium tenue]|uniref:Uncharacterized protein n=1 Tax=Chaetomium tenue TaxID=1854479 RepID=A0ACB7PT15_9PEZI|nr:hypothetical protein F5144DRAFT_556663 [Chaetomium globosum]
MRLQAITLSLLAATGLATPIRRDVGQAVYTLRLTSPVKSLDGLYLTTSPPQSDTDDTTTLGVSTSTTPSPATKPVRFYPVRNPDTDLDELRRASDTGGGALAVVGANGLLDFAALADPEAVQAPDGTTVDWTSFRLGAEKEGGAVEYVGKGGVAEGRWVAFPVGGEGERWSVKWRDVSAWTTENYMPVEVVYELVKEE